MKFKLFSIFLCLGIGWLGGFVLFIVLLPQTHPPIAQKTDALVVLTGGSDRLTAALALMHQHVSDKILISGVHPQTTLKDILNLDPKKNSMLTSDKIFLDYNAHTTFENAQQTLEWIQKYQIKSIRLVTAHYHMPRALLEFRQNIVQVEIFPHCIVPRIFGTSYWLSSKDVLWLLWREYHKYLGALGRSYFKSLVFYNENKKL